MVIFCIAAYTLYKENAECQGGSEVNQGRMASLDDCATACYGVSDLFIYGTNDYSGYPPYCLDDGCYCHCETDQDSSGDVTVCRGLAENAYRIYRFTKGKIILLLKMYVMVTT